MTDIEIIDKALEDMKQIYAAVLRASTLVLPYCYYNDEQKKLAGIVPAVTKE